MGQRSRLNDTAAQTSLAILERQVQRLGGLAPDEHLIDSYAGRLLRFFEEGRESSSKPRSKLPWVRSLLVATYTARQMIFFGNGFAKNCPVGTVYRAAVHDERLIFLFTTKPAKRLSMIEMSATGRGGRGAQRFADAVNEASDRALEENVKDKAAAEQLSEFFAKVRAYPPEQILELVVDGESSP